MYLETERLILRGFRLSDLADLHEFLSDEETVRFEPYNPMDMEEAEKALAWRLESDEMIAVELKESGKLIGNVYLGKREFLSLEIGYVFNRAFWGKGYALESCHALMEQAFSDGAHRIYAECDPLNDNSWRLLEALGFTREAHLHSNVYFQKDENGHPVWKDTYIYAILNKEQ